MSRPYTGNRDVASSALPGTRKLQDWLLFLFPGSRDLGIYANRTVRGGQARSVHATGRAADIGGDRETVKKIIDWLYQHRRELQIEAVHDYIGAWIPTQGFGAGYRCDRDRGGLFSGWKVYESPTIGRGGSWTHYELAPAAAKDPDVIDGAIEKLLIAATREKPE